MMPILNIGPLAIQLPGLIILLGLWLGLTLAERYAARFNVKANHLYNIVFITLIAGLVGARLANVLRYPQAFSSNLWNVLSLNISLLDPWGGIAVGIICALIYGQRKGMRFWPTMDALTPAMAVFFVTFSIAQLASGAGFGAPTEMPWGTYLWGAIRHPSQIYEAIASTMILFILWPTRIHLIDRIYGTYFLTFAALSAGARLFLEAFRGDSIILAGGIRAAQVVAWLILTACLWGLYVLQQKNPQKLS